MYTLEGVRVVEGGLACFLWVFLKKPNTGNNCGGREDKFVSKTLEINGLAERFNWDAHYKLPLNK